MCRQPHTDQAASAIRRPRRHGRRWSYMLPLGLFLAVMLMTLAGLDDPVGLKAASAQRSQDLVLRVARPS
ncbi:hypothetical protein ACFQ4K_19110 [Tistrella bauzanensis]